jgi:hypothetical protein
MIAGTSMKMKKRNVPISVFASAAFFLAAPFPFDFEVEAFSLSSGGAVDTPLPLEAAFAFLGGATAVCLPLDAAFLTDFDIVNHVKLGG